MANIDANRSLIDAARQLRKIADDAGNAELKSRILDVVLQLHEVREELNLGGGPAAETDSALVTSGQSTTEIPTTAAPALAATDGGQPARLEPSGNSETYALAAMDSGSESSADETAAEPTAAEDATQDAKRSTEDGAASSDGGKEPEGELSEEERFALAEQRIAELEPLHQAALKKMNDALTPEQAARKAAATKKGVAEGLKGKPLQDAVFAALNLTWEQQQTIAEGKRELHQVRLAIGKQVEGLLSKDQLDQLLRSHRH